MDPETEEWNERNKTYVIEQQDSFEALSVDAWNNFMRSNRRKSMARRSCMLLFLCVAALSAFTALAVVVRRNKAESNSSNSLAFASEAETQSVNTVSPSDIFDVADDSTASPSDLLDFADDSTASASPSDLTDTVDDSTASASPSDLTDTADDSTASASPSDLTDAADDSTASASPSDLTDAADDSTASPSEITETSVSLVAEPGCSVVTTDATCYVADSTISVSIFNCSPMERDWIGIYSEGSDVSNLGEPFLWFRSCSSSSCEGEIDMSSPDATLAEGSYQAHLIRRNPGGPYVSYQASTPFQVASSC
jgi:hypothetical protein